MRISVKLTPETDIDWRPEMRYKMRGHIWSSLEDTKFRDLHDKSDAPTFSFSNIFSLNNSDPSAPLLEGDDCLLLVASPHPGLLSTVQAHFDTQSRVEIGDAVFEVEDARTRTVDVGPVGTTGKIKVHTGVYLRLPEEERDKYDIDGEREYGEGEVLSWIPKYGVEIFKSRIMDNAKWKLESTLPTINSYPEQFNDLFAGFTVTSIYSTNMNVTEEHSHKFIACVCEFEYAVEDENQRRWLNTLLDTGLGWKNSLGFGFTNIVEKDIPEDTIE